MQLRFIACLFGSILLLTHAFGAAHPANRFGASDAVNRSLTAGHSDWISHSSRPVFKTPVFPDRQTELGFAWPVAADFAVAFRGAFSDAQCLLLPLCSRPPPVV